MSHAYIGCKLISPKRIIVFIGWILWGVKTFVDTDRTLMQKSRHSQKIYIIRHCYWWTGVEIIQNGRCLRFSIRRETGLQIHFFIFIVYEQRLKIFIDTFYCEKFQLYFDINRWYTSSMTKESELIEKNDSKTHLSRFLLIFF